MDLDVWVKLEKQRLDSWKRMWREKHSADPDNWPLSMPAGEWDEQYRAHVEG